MATKPYKLYNTTATTQDAAASLKITRRGVITSINMSIAGVAGAAVNACRQIELSKQSTRSITTNDTPPGVLAEVAAAANISAGSYCNQQLIAGLSIPVDVGDTLYLHNLAVGTASSTVTDSVMVYVNES